MTRFGILGPGRIARRFAGALAMVDGAQLTAAASRSPDKARAFAQEFGCRAMTYDELMCDENVDIVYISTTHNTHAELAAECLRSRKAVLCEKPMTLHGADARALAALAKEQNTLLMEGMWTNFLPAVKQARRFVEQGAVGQVCYVDAGFCIDVPYMPESRMYDPALAGGGLYDLGVYPIELALFLLGEHPISQAATVLRAPTGADCFVALSLEFPGGAVAGLRCGLTVNMPSDACVYGTEGKIVLPGKFWDARRCELYNKEGTLVDSVEFDDPEGFVFQIRHVCELLSQGLAESPVMPWRDSIACADIFDRVLGEHL